MPWSSAAPASRWSPRATVSIRAWKSPDLLNLLKLLDNPLQDIPLLAVLRSPLVSLSLAELAQIRAGNDVKPFWTAMTVWHKNAVKQPADDSRGLPSSPATRHSTHSKVSAFLALYSEWRSLVRQSSLSQCLETVLVETHYEEILLAGQRGVERVGNVRRLLDLARQFDPYQRQGLYRFLRFVQAQEDAELDLQPAPPPTADAVRLMSVHKSKGLEFPVGRALACTGALSQPEGPVRAGPVERALRHLPKDHAARSRPLKLREPAVLAGAAHREA